MAYRFDTYDQALVIDGWENGVADNPYAGLADMRNCNIISVPGEVSVNFATAKISAPAYNGTMTNSSAAANTVTLTVGALEQGQAIQFSVLSDATKGIALSTPYWVVGSSGTYTLYSNYARTSLVDITADSLTGTWATVNMGRPKHFAYASREGVPTYWLIDHTGYVWSNANPTSSNAYWTWTGNKPNNGSNGNGLVYYAASDGTGYIFAFSNNSIDFTPSSGNSVAWTYQWNFMTAATGSFNANPTTTLKTGLGTSNSHEAMVMPTNQVIFCDSNWVGRFYENNPATPFVPTTANTYVADQTALLPTTDIANCLAYLGTNILVGGSQNIVYPWNGTATTFNYPILIAESNIVKMVTINTNAYMLVGNRGRIYITNGTNAVLYKKVPDHVSGTVEPYYTWGGLTSAKNQLYFGVKGLSNAGNAIDEYGGLWAIDVDTKAMRLVNKLSYGTYAGYASAIIPNFGTTPAGTGLYIGWDDGASGYGLDTTSGTPYTGSQAAIDSDLIPIGTYSKPRDFTKVEFLLTRPLVSGESITINTRLLFDKTDSVTAPGQYAQTYTNNTVGTYTGQGDINFKNALWCQFQIVLNSTNSSPNFVRLKHLRILGMVLPTLS